MKEKFTVEKRGERYIVRSNMKTATYRIVFKDEKELHIVSNNGAWFVVRKEDVREALQDD